MGMETQNPDFETLWQTAQLTAPAETLRVCSRLLEMQNRYIKVADALELPWQLIGAIHYRESALSFDRCLHNGEPLPGPTVHVPAGRGPFKSWEEAAVDALSLHNINISDNSVKNLLRFAEAYNGRGYRKHGILSPYVWAGTQHYVQGKYGSDGHFDGSLVDKQVGVAALLLGMGMKHGF